jgi:hypothetical protein
MLFLVNFLERGREWGRRECCLVTLEVVVAGFSRGAVAVKDTFDTGAAVGFAVRFEGVVAIGVLLALLLALSCGRITVFTG